MEVGQHKKHVTWSLGPNALGLGVIIIRKQRYLFSFHHVYIY